MPDPNPLKQIQGNARDQVTAAREAVSKLRGVDDLTPAQTNLVDTAYNQLTELEDLLKLQNLNKRIKSLQGSAADLDQVCAHMKRSVDKLKKVAKVIDDAAKAVAALADIIAKGASAGIL